MIKKQIKLVHFQLTERCNLRCRFCGQWGENGFLQGKYLQPELPLSEWKKAIDSLTKYSIEEKVPLADIVLWGGEPFLYTHIVSLLEYLKEKAFKVAVVTNGTKLIDFAEVINECVDCLYFSLDGPQHIHDKIRGEKGLYEKVVKNLKLINSKKVNTVCLTYLNQDNYTAMLDLIQDAASLNLNELMIHNLIHVSEKDAQNYKQWMKQVFKVETSKMSAWKSPDSDYINKLPDSMAKITKKIAELATIPNKKLKVKLFPEEITPNNVLRWYLDGDEVIPQCKEGYCYAPFCHLHIRPNGNVDYCVDFDDFVAGNILNSDLINIFNNELSDRFREEIINNNNPICKRCPWLFNRSFRIDYHNLRSMRKTR